MLRKATAFRPLILLFVCSTVHAQTCITIQNVRGQTAHKNNGYIFVEDGISAELTFCYDGDEGRFSHTEAPFRRFGRGTWIGTYDGGNRTEVVTFDLSAKKALLVQTRATGMFGPPMVSAFVGDIR